MKRIPYPAVVFVVLALIVLPARADDADPALKAIQALLQEGSPALRCQALRSLGRLPKETAMPVLLEALEKQSDIDATMACVSLAGDFGDERAVAPLLKVFSRKLKDEGVAVGGAGDLDGKIRDVEDAVRKAKEPEKLKKLTEELKDLQKAKEQRREAQLRLQAVYLLVIDALGRIGSKDSTPKLLDLAASESPCVRYCVLGALGRIEDPAILTGLEKVLASGSVEGRGTALRGMDEMATIARPGVEDLWIQRALASMVVADIENSDKTIAATALQWVVDLGAAETPALGMLPRILAYRDLLRANDADNKRLVDFELMGIYLKHKAIRRALKPVSPPPAGATVGTK